MTFEQRFACELDIIKLGYRDAFVFFDTQLSRDTALVVGENPGIEIANEIISLLFQHGSENAAVEFVPEVRIKYGEVLDIMS